MSVTISDGEDTKNKSYFEVLDDMEEDEDNESGKESKKFKKFMVISLVFFFANWLVIILALTAGVSGLLALKAGTKSYPSTGLLIAVILGASMFLLWQIIGVNGLPRVLKAMEAGWCVAVYWLALLALTISFFLFKFSSPAAGFPPSPPAGYRPPV